MLNKTGKKCSICGGTYQAFRMFKNRYTEELVCEDCLLELDGITTETTYHYFLDGEYIGNDDEIDEVYKNICFYNGYEEVKDDE